MNPQIGSSSIVANSIRRVVEAAPGLDDGRRAPAGGPGLIMGDARARSPRSLRRPHQRGPADLGGLLEEAQARGRRGDRSRCSVAVDDVAVVEDRPDRRSGRTAADPALPPRRRRAAARARLLPRRRLGGRKPREPRSRCAAPSPRAPRRSSPRSTTASRPKRPFPLRSRTPGPRPAGWPSRRTSSRSARSRSAATAPAGTSRRSSRSGARSRPAARAPDPRLSR